jgi:hypothetical protein
MPPHSIRGGTSLACKLPPHKKKLFSSKTHAAVTELTLSTPSPRGSDTKIKYAKQTHGEAMLTSILFNEDGLHPYIGKDSTESVTCKPKTTRLLTKN